MLVVDWLLDHMQVEKIGWNNFHAFINFDGSSGTMWYNKTPSTSFTNKTVPESPRHIEAGHGKEGIRMLKAVEGKQTIHHPEVATEI